MLEKGYIHIYTGNGKGKTTAALGLALRAAGAGLRTIMVQFMKGRPSSETEAVKYCNGMIEIIRFGSMNFFIAGDPSSLDEHRSESLKAMARAFEAMTVARPDILVLDEIFLALNFGLISEEDILNLMNKKNPDMELVLTGRGATGPIIERADLVTDMKEVKHYYTAGIEARKGIEE